MITEAIIVVFSKVVAFLVGLIPGWTAPAWLSDVTGTMGDAVGNITMLSGWVPVQAVGTVCAFTLACFSIALGIRLARIVLSLATGGGGSAA